MAPGDQYIFDTWGSIYFWHTISLLSPYWPFECKHCQYNCCLNSWL